MSFGERTSASCVCVSLNTTNIWQWLFYCVCSWRCECLTIPDAFSLPLFNSHIGILYAAIRSKRQYGLQWTLPITCPHVQRAPLIHPATDRPCCPLEVRRRTLWFEKKEGVSWGFILCVYSSHLQLLRQDCCLSATKIWILLYFPVSFGKIQAVSGSPARPCGSTCF